MPEFLFCFLHSINTKLWLCFVTCNFRFARDWLLLLRAEALLADPDSRGLGVLEARKIRARGTCDVCVCNTFPYLAAEIQRNCKDGCDHVVLCQWCNMRDITDTILNYFHFSLTYELYEWGILDCRLFLKFVASPEE